MRAFSWDECPLQVLRVLALMGPGNFVFFFVVSYALGGDALQGRRDGGAYSLGNHGHFVQVSESTYWLSYFLVASLLVTVPVSALVWRRLLKDRDPVILRIAPLGGTIVWATVLTGFAWGVGLPPAVVIPGVLATATIALAVQIRQSRKAKS